MGRKCLVQDASARKFQLSRRIFDKIIQVAFYKLAKFLEFLIIIKWKN